MKQFEFISAKRLDKIVNYLFIDENVFQIHVIVRYLIAHLIMLNVNVFDSFMMLKVFDENDNALIVIENNNHLK